MNCVVSEAVISAHRLAKLAGGRTLVEKIVTPGDGMIVVRLESADGTPPVRGGPVRMIIIQYSEESR